MSYRTGQMGVYAVVNTLNQNRYIGSSTHLTRRKNQHFRELRKGIHANVHLQDAYRMDGGDVFEFEILEVLDSRERLMDREQFWMEFYSSSDRSKGYNICPKAELKPPPFNRPHSQISRKKISEGMKARCAEGDGAAHIKRLQAWHTGRRVSTETRLKMIEAAKRREERYRREGPRVLRRTLT